ncbi:MAG: MCE family protein [Candidatus Melainabacteria bacterium]|nr:MCE family protein [Candidatus Melainabacteria bacterium]
MLRFFLSILTFFILVVSVYAYLNSQRTFEARFKNIDGLPIGAQVTALGVPVGKVIKTRPSKDGIIVTVKITNERVPRLEPGSQLTITSFRPNQGRVLEIIPPEDMLSETKAWIVQEPITTESWLHASLELLDSLKSFSETVIQYVTPENFERARLVFSKASESLSQTASKLAKNEEELSDLSKQIASEGAETNLLLLKLHEPIEALNKIVSDKNLKTSLSNDLGNFSGDLTEISRNITSENFVTNIIGFKVKILDHLNHVNASLIAADKKITDPTLLQNLKSFNEHVTNLNNFYEDLSKQDLKKITSDFTKKAKESTTKASKATKKLQNTQPTQN